MNVPGHRYNTRRFVRSCTRTRPSSAPIAGRNSRSQHRSRRSTRRRASPTHPSDVRLVARSRKAQRNTGGYGEESYGGGSSSYGGGSSSYGGGGGGGSYGGGGGGATVAVAEAATAAVGAATIVPRARCMTPFVPIAARRRRCPSSRPAAARSTATTVSARAASHASGHRPHSMRHRGAFCGRRLLVCPHPRKCSVKSPSTPA